MVAQGLISATFFYDVEPSLLLYPLATQGYINFNHIDNHEPIETET